MKATDLETREKIMKCTLELVKSEKDYSKITIRRIVSAAGVSLSAVNYHFGSKERLINEVIEKPIFEFLSSGVNPYEKYAADPVKMLKEAVKLPARYLAENPNISRVSILSDMTAPIDSDLTGQTINYLMPAAGAALPGMDEKAIGLELWSLISLIQTAFLRSRAFSRMTGVDFFSDEDRDAFLEKYVDILICKNRGVACD